MKKILAISTLLVLIACTSAPPTASPEQVQTAAAEILTAQAPTTTPTITPTATPFPSPTSSLSTNQLAYLDKAEDAIAEHLEIHDAFSEKHSEAAERVSLLLNQQWITEMALILTDFNLWAERVRDWPAAPPGFEELESMIIKVADQTEELVDVYADAVDNLDADGFGEASGILISMFSARLGVEIEIIRLQENE